MPRSLHISCCIWIVFLAVLVPLGAFSQSQSKTPQETPPKSVRIKGEKPNQLDIVKVDVLQLGINEARFWYEMQRGTHSSLEFGLGAIYKNGFWYDRGDRPMLAYGGGVYFGYRIYMDEKKIFSEPKFRSYFSPLLFYRYSTFKNEWISYTSSNSLLKDCNLYSERIHQAGAVVRFGWLTAMGRVAMDIYTGLGFKFIPSVLTHMSETPGTTVCEVNQTTHLIGETETFYGTNVILNAGVKLGIRRNNKESHSHEALQELDPNPETPPPF